MAEIVLFEVFLAPGSSGASLLSEETLAETEARVMTEEETAQAGYGALPEDASGRPRVLVACSRSHARRVQNNLEASADVDGFHIHTVDA